MAMVANDPKAAKRLGIKQSVGEEFMKADKGRKFGTGGDVNYTFGGNLFAIFPSIGLRFFETPGSR